MTPKPHNLAGDAFTLYRIQCSRDAVTFPPTAPLHTRSSLNESDYHVVYAFLLQSLLELFLVLDISPTHLHSLFYL